MHTVELTVDRALDDRVRSVWQRLHAAGLPSLATHRHATNRPHLTLAAADRLTPEVGSALGGLPVEAVLDGLVFFERAVVWRVLPTGALLDLHAEVWRALAGAGRNPLHAPGSWTPHVSLALRATERARYVSELRDLPVTRGSFVRARSYDSVTRTVTDLSCLSPPHGPAPER